MTGARHLIAGDFTAAVAADRDAVRAHAAEFGSDDPRTFSVLHSLIADLALSGAAVAAGTAARDLHRNCLAFYGDACHPAVLAANGVLRVVPVAGLGLCRCRQDCGRRPQRLRRSS